MKEVRKVRALSPVCPSAKFDVNVVELLKKIISENVYKSDYVDITEELLEEKLNYETAIPALRQLAERRVALNHLANIFYGLFKFFLCKPGLFSVKL